MAVKVQKFTDIQTPFIIKHGQEGASVPEVTWMAGIRQATYLYSMKKYAIILSADLKKRYDMEGDFWRLMNFVADVVLDSEMLEDVIKRMN